MRKNNMILGIARIFIVITISVLIVFKSFEKDIWDISADKFKESCNLISGDADIENLSKFTLFKWDTLYSFTPYTSKEKIYETIGYKWDDISETVSEEMNQIVFIDDGKVVCYFYGYPENIKLGFNFGEYKGSYIKLTAEQKPRFKTTISEKGIRYFNYIKD